MVVGSLCNLLIVRGVVEVSKVSWIIEIFFVVAGGRHWSSSRRQFCGQQSYCARDPVGESDSGGVSLSNTFRCKKRAFAMPFSGLQVLSWFF